MQDEDIINLYFSRNQRAIEETECKYGRYCHQIAMQILHDSQDAEETANDALLRAWNSIPPCRPTILKLYLAKITRNLAFDRYRFQTSQKRCGKNMELALEELGDCVKSSQQIDDDINKAELTASIHRLLLTLPSHHRCVFIRRYFFVESIEQISARYGIKKSNVHMILSRVRKKLKTHLIKEGFFL